MLNERGWGVDKLRRHYDWNKKICPRIFYDGGKWTGWQQFKQAVQRELDKLKGGAAVSDKNVPSSWAKEAWEWAKKEGITDGTNPQGAITREQVVTMLYRFFQLLMKVLGK
jgi:N-acetylmuramoyl-L-alanine amidase